MDVQNSVKKKSDLFFDDTRYENSLTLASYVFCVTV